jgi:hypothetical protein
MSDRVVRTEKRLTIVEARPYHRYVSGERPGGNAIVERAYDARVRGARKETRAAGEFGRIGVTTGANE